MDPVEAMTQSVEARKMLGSSEVSGRSWNQRCLSGMEGRAFLYGETVNRRDIFEKGKPAVEGKREGREEKEGKGRAHHSLAISPFFVLLPFLVFLQAEKITG